MESKPNAPSKGRVEIAAPNNADIDATVLGPHPSDEELLDFAVELTFPASDPISVTHASGSARDRQAKLKVSRVKE